MSNFICIFLGATLGKFAKNSKTSILNDANVCASLNFLVKNNNTHPNYFRIFLGATFERRTRSRISYIMLSQFWSLTLIVGPEDISSHQETWQITPAKLLTLQLDHQWRALHFLGFIIHLRISQYLQGIFMFI